MWKYRQWIKRENKWNEKLYAKANAVMNDIKWHAASIKCWFQKVWRIIEYTQ